MAKVQSRTVVQRRTVIRRVTLDEVLGLRDLALTPGHPGRPVVWPYDHEEGARNFGLFVDGRLTGCVSVSPAALSGSDPGSSYRIHSMAIQPDLQRRGWGTALLRHTLQELVDAGATCAWATARKSAVGFYEKFGMEVVEGGFVVEETGVAMPFVVLRGEALVKAAKRQ